MTTAAPSVFLRGLSRRQLIACDAVLAVGVAVLGWLAAAEVPLSSSRVSWHEPAWVSVLIGVLLGVPVAARRLRPEAAAWSAIALCVFASGTGAIPDYAGIAPSLVLGLVLYTVGTDVRRRRSVLVVILGIAVLGVAFVWSTREPYQAGLVLWVLGICWTLGRAIRERRAYAAQSATQATELALRAERLRIARDLHDIVAHNMSVIVVRATVADHIAEVRPEELRESLRLIATTSRETLAQLRGAVGALRAEAVVAPTPGLADLGELVAAARSAGLAVDLEVRGDRAVPESVGVAVFRLVQEAVTNVLKHARATTCRIEVDLAPGEVRLKVTDNGKGVGPAADGSGGAGAATAMATRATGRMGAAIGGTGTAIGGTGAGYGIGGTGAGYGIGGAGGGGVAIGGVGGGGVAIGGVGGGGVGGGVDGGGGDEAGGTTGQGLIGMRERAAMFGGELVAGPGPEGGWRVATTLRYSA
ncbi:histidine kinase [Actinoplanes sp. NPDC051513]|uniref:ATP-binding protein n=1 Tax=Actinoplanes sp. NPDC051513 TaxID=3363908 RepID=UPI003792D18F